jgi:ketosteroid isomerase-like protein
VKQPGRPGQPPVERDVTAADRDLLLRAFAAYNAQDAEGLLDLVSDDVDWPDGSRRLQGQVALRGYWTAQWLRTRTHDQPLQLDRRPDGRIAVRLTRVVRSLEERVLDHGTFDYVFRLDASHIVRLDIEET